MAAILVVLAGAVVMDVIDDVVRGGTFQRRVALATSLRTVAAIEVTGISTAAC